MLGPSKRPHRVRFERRAEADDGYGNTRSDWTPFISRMWAGLRPQFGRERINSDVLQATNNAVLTVLRSSISAQLLESDRVVFLIGPYKDKIAAIKSIVPATDSTEIEMVIDIGGPT
jgi:head-tail adaptor